MERLTAHSARRQSSLRAVLRDPARNTLFPAATATKLQSFDALLQRFERLAKHLSPARLLATILEETHYSEYLKAQHQDKSRVLSGERNLADLMTWLERLDQRAEQPLTLAEILSQLALASSDDDDADADQVRLMTLHAAKGLEFPHVFMVGVEEGILPHQNSIDEVGDHEERRLMYVGITRAQQSLTISYTKKRTRYGETAMCKPAVLSRSCPAR